MVAKYIVDVVASYLADLHNEEFVINTNSNASISVIARKDGAKFGLIAVTPPVQSDGGDGSKREENNYSRFLFKDDPVKHDAADDAWLVKIIAIDDSFAWNLQLMVHVDRQVCLLFSVEDTLQWPYAGTSSALYRRLRSIRRTTWRNGRHVCTTVVRKQQMETVQCEMMQNRNNDENNSCIVESMGDSDDKDEASATRMDEDMLATTPMPPKIIPPPGSTMDDVANMVMIDYGNEQGDELKLVLVKGGGYLAYLVGTNTVVEQLKHTLSPLGLLCLPESMPEEGGGSVLVCLAAIEHHLPQIGWNRL